METTQFKRLPAADQTPGSTKYQDATGRILTIGKGKNRAFDLAFGGAETINIPTVFFWETMENDVPTGRLMLANDRGEKKTLTTIIGDLKSAVEIKKNISELASLMD